MKATPALDNIVLVAVNLDPFNAQSGFVEVPFDEFGYADRSDSYAVRDLLTGERFEWHGRRNYIALDPHTRPAHVLRLER